MYLLPIQVPIYLDGDSRWLTTEWHRSLLLLRDSFAGRFGPVAVIAPSLPARSAPPEQQLVKVEQSADGLQLFPSFDKRCRARQFWMRDRARWQADLAERLPRAQVVHAGVDDVYRPIAFEGFRAAIRKRIAAVFVQDTDNVVQQRQIFARRGAAERVKSGAYTFVYERMCRWAVARADLSLLKGSGLIRRYGKFARNAKEFHDTSFSLADIVSASNLEIRLTTLSHPRPIRLVYCGRLVARKGVDRSLRILAAARAAGASIEFDIIGDGPELSPLKALASELSLAPAVRFHGSAPYDSLLLRRLSECDALFFTPIAEDTPRMIFDGYAAGLPLIGFDIPYVVERAEQEHATALLPSDQIEKSAAILVQLDRARQKLTELSRAARSAAEYHAAENWYRRRADWTIEAVDRHRAAVSPAAISAGRAA
jgi:glycosyltransferase involved in cell wall biosynthesis